MGSVSCRGGGGGDAPVWLHLHKYAIFQNLTIRIYTFYIQLLNVPKIAILYVGIFPRTYRKCAKTHESRQKSHILRVSYNRMRAYISMILYLFSKCLIFR